MKRGCDLLILKNKIKRSQPRFTRQLLQGGMPNMAYIQPYSAIDSGSPSPMMKWSSIRTSTNSKAS